MSDIENNKRTNMFSKVYEKKFDKISKNLMVHLSNSPYRYSSKIETERINLSNRITQSMNDAVDYVDSQMASIISVMRVKELGQAKRLGAFCYEQLIKTVDNELTLKQINNEYNTFKNCTNSNKNYETIIIYLNKLFTRYSNIKLSSVIDKEGYYNYSGLFDKQAIKDFMSEQFEAFVNIFKTSSTSKHAFGYLDEIKIDGKTKKISQVRTAAQIKTNFNEVMKKLLDKQNEAEAIGDWEKAGVCQAVIEYCSGRGITLLSHLYKEIGSFEKARSQMIEMTDNEQLQNIYSSSRKQHVHLTIRQKNRKGVDQKESLEGSFYGAIKSPNRGGVILEYLDKGLFQDKTVINFKKDKITLNARNTGKNLNVLGKSQKNDLLLTFSMGFKDNFDYNKKEMNKNSKNKKNNSNIGINNNPSQIGISIKNYVKDRDVTVHSAGNLKTIGNFLRTYSIKIEDFCDIIEKNPMLDYLLINDRNDKNSILYKSLREALAKQGAIFTLTPFITKDKKSQAVDESVDFFLIDQILVPGSLIMQYANDANNSKFAYRASTTSKTGFYTKITNDSDITDEDVQKFNKSISKKIRPALKKEKKKFAKEQEKRKLKGQESLKTYFFPYYDDFISNTETLGEKVFNKIHFTIEMRNAFRKNLERKILNLKEAI